MLASLLLAAPAALACGQTTHVTVALWAIERVADPELRALVADPEVKSALVAGAMFPDGGYSPIVNHEYGEISHWEPFQLAYLETLRGRGPEWVGDDRRRVAFLLGLAAHGIADQAYDAAYLRRAETKDAEAPRLDSADTETDVAFGAEVGGLPVEPRWVPYEELVPVFASVGVEVDVDTLELGMASLDLAILYVANAAEDEARVETARRNWPWATSHLLDREVPGSPELLADVVADYWEVLWERLHDRPVDDRFVLATWPAADAAEEGEDALVSVVLARAVSEATVEAAGQVRVEAAGGEVPSQAWMFYGDRTNVLNLEPTGSWGADTEHTVTLRAGISTFDGWTLPEDRVARFSTAPAPADPEGEAEAGEGCGCGRVGEIPSVAVALALPWAIRRRRSR